VIEGVTRPALLIEVNARWCGGWHCAASMEGAMSTFNIAYLLAVICTIFVLTALVAWDEHCARHHHP
jgi:hypothetical protein